MSHYPSEAHISTLSHAVKRLSNEEKARLLDERKEAIRRVMQSTCMEDRYQFGLPSKG